MRINFSIITKFNAYFSLSSCTVDPSLVTIDPFLVTCRRRSLRILADFSVSTSESMRTEIFSQRPQKVSQRLNKAHLKLKKKVVT